MELLQDLRREFDLTILMVTHDISMARFADRVLTLRDGALGQDLSGSEDERPHLEDDGRIQLPTMVRSTLADVDHITVEIRPEGVLLRPEVADADEDISLLEDMIPEDEPPEAHKRRFLGRRSAGPGTHERVAYCPGHRAGTQFRQRLNSSACAARG